MSERLTPAQALAAVAETVYPLDVFPAPPLPLVAQVLKDAGLTIDALSAEIARQMLNRVAHMGVEAIQQAGYVIVHPDDVRSVDPNSVEPDDAGWYWGWTDCRDEIFFGSSHE